MSRRCPLQPRLSHAVTSPLLTELIPDQSGAPVKDDEPIERKAFLVGPSPRFDS